jgi:hypothetical protein
MGRLECYVVLCTKKKSVVLCEWKEMAESDKWIPGVGLRFKLWCEKICTNLSKINGKAICIFVCSTEGHWKKRKIDHVPKISRNETKEEWWCTTSRRTREWCQHERSKYGAWMIKCHWQFYVALDSSCLWWWWSLWWKSILIPRSWFNFVFWEYFGG